jgi:hypothetical protein
MPGERTPSGVRAAVENGPIGALVWTHNPEALRRDKPIRERRPGLEPAGQDAQSACASDRLDPADVTEDAEGRGGRCVKPEQRGGTVVPQYPAPAGARPAVR